MASSSTFSETKKTSLLEKYEDIIRDSNDPSKAICTICSKPNFISIFQWNGLDQHVKGPTHQGNLKLKNGMYTETPDTDNRSQEWKAKPTKLNELGLNFRLAQFILENRLSFSVVEPLVALIKELTTDYRTEILKKASLNRTVLQKIISDCIAEDLKEDILAKLRTQPFSLSVDGSSDMYGCSYLSVSAKYLDKRDGFLQPVTSLVSILPMVPPLLVRAFTTNSRQIY